MAEKSRELYWIWYIIRYELYYMNGELYSHWQNFSRFKSLGKLFSTKNIDENQDGMRSVWDIDVCKITQIHSWRLLAGSYQGNKNFSLIRIIVLLSR